MVTEESHIALRTNASSRVGLGHLYRCVELCREFKELGMNCVVVVDRISDLVRNLCGDIVSFGLYDDGDFVDENDDFIRFEKAIKGFYVSKVVVDDYRLGADWEEKASRTGYCVCVIDDLAREHSCNLLVDQKWRGGDFSVYDGKTPDYTTKLLGPNYAIVNKKFSAVGSSKSDGFNVLISVGGGGNAAQIEQIIASFREISVSGMKLTVVCGPLMEDIDRLIEKQSAEDLPVELIVGETDLSSIVSRSHVFIGAAGGMMYQCVAASVPMITFSLSENQANRLEELADFGHYFHFSKEEIDFSKIAKICVLIKENYTRVLKLVGRKTVDIDCRGAERICRAILAKEPRPENIQVRPISRRWDKISDRHRVRPVDDADINSYLEARNRDSNRTNMSVTSVIPRTEHYLWWFNNDRCKFVVESEGVEKLYLWHEAVVFEMEKYLIGGWFSKSSSIDVFDVIAAVDWQLRTCHEEYPEVPWLAIIKRGNKFVKTLNSFFGFEEVEEETRHGNVIKQLFNVSSNQDFHFLMGDSALVVGQV